MKPLIQNIRAPSIGQTIVPLAMITSLLLAFTSNCSGLLAQPEDPNSSGQISGYIINVPPGKTIEVVLPAVCLDYSKDIPKPDTRFSSQLGEVPPEARRLLDLNQHILLREDAYKRQIAQISALRILTIENHRIVTPNGGNETVSKPFKAALAVALQYAIWQNDPKFMNSQTRIFTALKENIRQSQQILEDLKAGGDGIGLDADTQGKIRLLRQMGVWDSVKAELFREIELSLAKAELELEWLEAVTMLASVMRQAIGADVVSAEPVELSP